MPNDIPLVPLGEVPNEIPTLEASGIEIEHYNIDWVSPAARRSLNMDGTLPTQTVRISHSSLDIGVSTSAPPLSLTVSIFAGTVTTVDPVGDAIRTIPCTENSEHCKMSVKDDTTQVSIHTADLPDDYVVSVFAEYWRDPNYDTSTGPTNLIGWIFGASNT